MILEYFEWLKHELKETWRDDIEDAIERGDGNWLQAIGGLIGGVIAVSAYIDHAEEGNSGVIPILAILSFVAGGFGGLIAGTFGYAALVIAFRLFKTAVLASLTPVLVFIFGFLIFHIVRFLFSPL